MPMTSRPFGLNRYRTPGVDQRLQKRGLAGPGDAGQQATVFRPAPNAWMAASCSFENRMPASSASTRSIAARIAASERLRRTVAGGRARHFGDALSRSGVARLADPLLAFVQAEDQRDRLAVVDWSRAVSIRLTTASTSSRPPAAPASIRPRAA